MSIDDLSDLLVSALATAVPSGALVLDHDALPVKVEDIPAGGVFGVFLFQDGPEGEDGTEDTTGKHRRHAVFKLEIRKAGATHLLHGTRAERRMIAGLIASDPFGVHAKNAWLGPFSLLVHETNSSIACGSLDLHVTYVFDPNE